MRAVPNPNPSPNLGREANEVGVEAAQFAGETSAQRLEENEMMHSTRERGLQ
jgi:hypothetical protein